MKCAFMLMTKTIVNCRNELKQNRQGLCKAKYCPRVAAILCTNK